MSILATKAIPHSPLPTIVAATATQASLALIATGAASLATTLLRIRPPWLWLCDNSMHCRLFRRHNLQTGSTSLNSKQLAVRRQRATGIPTLLIYSTTMTGSRNLLAPLRPPTSTLPAAAKTTKFMFQRTGCLKRLNWEDSLLRW